MSNMGVRDARVKVGTYEKDGQTKTRYMNIGVGFVSEHGSNVYLQIDTLPRDVANWDGRIFLSARGEKKPEPAADETDQPINMDDIPF
jgi:hypothetical protein